VASITPDVKRLRRFEKVDLKPGESRTITFTLPLKELAFVNTDNKKILEAGEFKIEIENLTSNFSVNKTMVF
jgi:beta-glucosidase